MNLIEHGNVKCIPGNCIPCGTCYCKRGLMASTLRARDRGEKARKASRKGKAP